MNKLLSSIGCALAVLVSAFVARADILPPGAKGVRNSLSVEGKIPRGKALLIANTFVGATPARVGAAVAVSWHPLSGPMRLMLVSAADAAKVPATDKADDARERKAIAESGIACSEPFSGTRTLPESSPAEDVRVVFHVEATATTCTATLLRTEYLSKDGKDVGISGTAAPSASAAPTPAPWEPPPPDAAAPPPIEPLPTTALPPARTGCAGCSLPAEDEATAGAFAAVLLLGLLARRALRRKVSSKELTTPVPPIDRRTR